MIINDLLFVVFLIYSRPTYDRKFCGANTGEIVIVNHINAWWNREKWRDLPRLWRAELRKADAREIEIREKGKKEALLVRAPNYSRLRRDCRFHATLNKFEFVLDCKSHRLSKFTVLRNLHDTHNSNYLFGAQCIRACTSILSLAFGKVIVYAEIR